MKFMELRRKEGNHERRDRFKGTNKDFEEKLKRELLPKEIDFLKDILSNERDDETSS